MVPDRLRRLYARTRWFHGPLFLLGGGVWDYYTLQLDRWIDNALLAFYLFLFAGVTVLDFRADLRLPVPAFATRWRTGLELAGQFALGGLLSAYFVHYLRGAPLQRELVWLGLLATLAVVNEVAEHTRRVPWLRVPLLGFAAFNYLLAVLPFATGQLVGPVLPLLGAGAVVAATLGVATTGARVGEPARNALFAGLGALALQVGLVLADLVPPLPLTLVDAEVTSAAEDDLYELSAVPELLAPVGLMTPELAWRPGEVVRVRTPIYLPASMATEVVHRWQHFQDGDWVTTDRIRLDVRGGREGGFRTFSHKRRTEPGDWRVVVETPDGRELGRVTWRLVVAAPEGPEEEGTL